MNLQGLATATATVVAVGIGFGSSLLLRDQAPVVSAATAQSLPVAESIGEIDLTEPDPSSTPTIDPSSTPRVEAPVATGTAVPSTAPAAISVPPVAQSLAATAKQPSVKPAGVPEPPSHEPASAGPANTRPPSPEPVATPGAPVEAGFVSFE